MDYFKANIRMLVAALGLLSASACLAEPAELDTLRKKRDGELARINDLYVAALDKLKQKYTKAGNLEAAVAIKAEIDKSDPAKKEVTPSNARDEPLDLGILREKRGNEFAKINRQYLAALEKLKVKYTKAGDLDSASSVSMTGPVSRARMVLRR